MQHKVSVIRTKLLIVSVTLYSDVIKGCVGMFHSDRV